MKKNIYKKWEPIPGLSNTMSLEALHNDYEGFRLLLKGRGNEEKTLRIMFDPVLAYRSLDEGDLLLYERFDETDNLEKWGFFTILRSSYLEWFHQVSQYIHSDEDVVHYAIYTENECLDILSSYYPKVEWLN